MSEPTEPASAKKIRQAREEGRSAGSRDAMSTAALLAAIGALVAQGDRVVPTFRALLDPALTAASTPGVPDVSHALAYGARQSVAFVLGPLVAGACAAVLVGALLTQFLFAPGAALPKLDRIDPFGALARYAKPRTYVEPLVQLLKGAACLALGWSVIRAAIPAMFASTGTDSVRTAHVMTVVAAKVAVRLLAAGAVFAGLDAFYRWWQLAKDLRMTTEDVKREAKESDGDPHTKAERERMHRELLNEATLNEVKRASFVVTNPTHYAVALAWDGETMASPELVAKGEGDFARRIIEEAHRHGIPVLRAAPLARSLHDLEVGDAIPEALFDAVAAVVTWLGEGRDPDAFDE